MVAAEFRRSAINRWLMTARVWLVIVALIASVAATACSDCAAIHTRRIESPDRRYSLSVNELDCGAIGHNRDVVTIRSTRPRLGIERLGHPEKEIFGGGIALDQVSTRWLDDHHVSITCSHCEDYGYFEKVERWRDVTFRFDLGTAKETGW